MKAVGTRVRCGDGFGCVRWYNLCSFDLSYCEGSLYYVVASIGSGGSGRDRDSSIIRLVLASLLLARSLSVHATNRLQHATCLHEKQSPPYKVTERMLDDSAQRAAKARVEFIPAVQSRQVWTLAPRRPSLTHKRAPLPLPLGSSPTFAAVLLQCDRLEADDRALPACAIPRSGLSSAAGECAVS